jgi:hypothetical protein
MRCIVSATFWSAKRPISSDAMMLVSVSAARCWLLLLLFSLYS